MANKKNNKVVQARPIDTANLWKGIGDNSSSVDFSTYKYNPSEMLQQSSNYITPSNISNLSGYNPQFSAIGGVSSPYKYSSDYPSIDNTISTKGEQFVIPASAQEAQYAAPAFNFDFGPLSGSGTAIKDFLGTDAFKNSASALFQGLGYMNARSSLKETKANNAYNRDMMNKQYGQFIDDKAGLSAIDWTSRDTSPQAQVDYNARKAAETTRLQNIK